MIDKRYIRVILKMLQQLEIGHPLIVISNNFTIKNHIVLLFIQSRLDKRIFPLERQTVSRVKSQLLTHFGNSPVTIPIDLKDPLITIRSEERRVGIECRNQGW